MSHKKTVFTHSAYYDADYEKMKCSIFAEAVEHKELTDIRVISSKDLYELDHQDYKAQETLLTGFEDLFDTEYLFAHHSVAIPELGELHTFS